ncbi:MAG: glycosyltransferase [Desulfovibrio sp.]|nr:glycosyltransferase [Desulfovibrio sp.]
MNPRTVLFIHQSFPGQFGSVAKSLAAQGHKVYALAMNPQEKIPGVHLLRYLPTRQPDYDKWPYLLKEMDSKIVRAESCYKAMKALKAKGLEPDVIYAHPGWGEVLFVKNIWPKARFVIYAEWFYNMQGQEVNFDPAFPPLSEEQELRLSLKNMSFLYGLSQCDAAVAPTKWQKSRYPAWAQEKIHVINEGLDLKELAMVLPRALGIPSQNLKLKRGMPIVTFSCRNLEPVRGFHYFMRALPAVLKAVPDAHVIVMGRDAGVQHAGYGAENPQGTTWRKSMEDELGKSVDWSRVHFLGFLDRKLYLSMLKLSACHVYLTTPFILSWSFLEACGLGLPVVASKTPPVEEFSHLKGLTLVDFTDVDGLGRAIIKNLQHLQTPFYDENLKAISDLDEKKTIPTLEALLLQDSIATSLGGGVVEDIVVVDEDTEEESEALVEAPKAAKKPAKKRAETSEEKKPKAPRRTRKKTEE